MLTQTYFGNGEFEFIQSRSEREYYQNMHKAITRTEMWHWLRNYTPPSNSGFMMRTTPEMNRINDEASKENVFGGHSGSSHAFTMRAMEAIAKNGYEAFKRSRTVTTAPVTTAPVSTSQVTTAPVTTAPVSTSQVTTAPITTAPIRTPLSRRAVLNRYEVYDEIIDGESSDDEHNRSVLLNVYAARPPAPPSTV
jgi:hypothetical protein